MDLLTKQGFTNKKQKKKKLNVNGFFLIQYVIKSKSFNISCLNGLTKFKFLTARSIELKFHVVDLKQQINLLRLFSNQLATILNKIIIIFTFCCRQRQSHQYLYQVQWSYPKVLLDIAMAIQGRAGVKFKVILGLLHLKE